MSADRSLANKAAIAGIGATEFSKESGRSELQLAAECVIDALADAGIDPAEVDGISTFKSDNNPESEVHRIIGGKNLKFFSRVDYGGGAACGVVMQAAMADRSPYSGGGGLPDFRRWKGNNCDAGSMGGGSGDGNGDGDGNGNGNGNGNGDGNGNGASTRGGGAIFGRSYASSYKSSTSSPR